MKRTRLIIASAMALFLAGCAWMPWMPWTKEEHDAKVTAIVELVKEGCKFEVQRDSVAAMLTAANPAFSGIGPIADAICDAVNKSAGDELKAAPKEGKCPLGEVNGVCIEGKRVN